MIKWIRPSGVPLETNDNEATRAYAKLNGWKREKKAKRVDTDGDSNASDQGLFATDTSTRLGG